MQGHGGQEEGGDYGVVRPDFARDTAGYVLEEFLQFIKRKKIYGMGNYEVYGKKREFLEKKRFFKKI